MVGDLVTGLDARFEVVRTDGFTARIELRVAAGTTTVMLGPNAAGKSTTVDALAGLLPIAAGRISLSDRVLDDPAAGVFIPPERRRVGVVFQGLLLFEHLTVGENIAFGPLAAGRRRAEAIGHAADLAARFELTDLVDRRPSELSGGQAQRVALVRALASDPALLLLDEPLSALDVDTRGTVRRRLRDDLDRFEGPRLLITHDPADAFLLADELVIVEEGRIVQRGAPDEVRRRPASTYAAAVAGTNLLIGSNRGGTVTLDEHRVDIHTSDTHTEGRVLVTVHPTAIALHDEEPHGSPRNTWLTTIASVEPLGESTRIMLDAPLPLGVDVTPGAVSALGLRPGLEVWASVKATEVSVSPAG